jgi:hypothetical protein
MIYNIDFEKNMLIFNFKFNQEITSDIINECIQKKIKKIIFNNYIDKECMYKHSNEYYHYKLDTKKKYINYFPNTWRGNRFNKNIDEFNKINLEHLILGSKFNQEVNNLPVSLVSLILSYEFNKPLHNLPNKLKTLSFKNCFKYSHDLDYLPESLEHIVIPPNFNKSLDNLPQNIRVLDLFNIYSYSLRSNMLSVLPSNLETIILNDKLLISINDRNVLNLITNYKSKYNSMVEIMYNSYDYFKMIIY